jgi:hypothetical protein
MWKALRKEAVFLRRPLNLGSRLLLILGAVCLITSAFLPMWNIRLVAPQYQEGLELHIYSHKLEAGNDGQDLVEINNLNHYIGMKQLDEADFVEMQWVPFALGIFALLGMRAAVFGRMSQIVDLFVLFVYFGAFSLGSFYYRLYSYGHDLDPKAPMTIDPFTPTMIGTNKIANFTQSSFPQYGSYVLLAFPILLLAAIWLSRKESLIEAE